MQPTGPAVMSGGDVSQAGKRLGGAGRSEATTRQAAGRPKGLALTHRGWHAPIPEN